MWKFFFVLNDLLPNARSRVFMFRPCGAAFWEEPKHRLLWGCHCFWFLNKLFFCIIFRLFLLSCVWESAFDHIDQQTACFSISWIFLSATSTLKRILQAVGQSRQLLQVLRTLHWLNPRGKQNAGSDLISFSLQEWRGLYTNCSLQNQLGDSVDKRGKEPLRTLMWCLWRVLVTK